MTDPILDALRQIVRRDQHLALRPGAVVELYEASATASLKRLGIRCDGCGDVFAFTLDVRKGGRHLPLSSHTSKATSAKWNKVCDGVFVWRDDRRVLRVLLCDLKSSHPSGGEWKQQLVSSACFVYYLLEISKRFFDYPPGVTIAPHFHAVAFHGTTHGSGRGKRATSISAGAGYPPSSLESPQRMAVSSRASLFLKALCR